MRAHVTLLPSLPRAIVFIPPLPLQRLLGRDVSGLAAGGGLVVAARTEQTHATDTHRGDRLVRSDAAQRPSPQRRCVHTEGLRKYRRRRTTRRSLPSETLRDGKFVQQQPVSVHGVQPRWVRDHYHIRRRMWDVFLLLCLTADWPQWNNRHHLNRVLSTKKNILVPFVPFVLKINRKCECNSSYTCR